MTRMHIVFQNALDGADSLFLILPDVVEDPTEDVFITMQAAKEAGVKHVLLQVSLNSLSDILTLVVMICE